MQFIILITITSLTQFNTNSELKLEIGKYSSPFDSFIFIDEFIQKNEPNMYTSLKTWKSIIDYKIEKKIELSHFDKILFERLKNAPKAKFTPEFN